MLTYTIETITEDLALRYLATEETNRPANQSVIRRYCNEMDAGRWKLNGEALKFDTRGRLRDGGHRLRARLLANRDFETLVIRGLAADSQWTMDQGRVRQAGQQLAMQGVADANTVAAGVRMYLSYTSGMLFRDNKVNAETITTPLIEQWVATNGESVQHMHGHLSQVKACDAPGSVAYCAGLILATINPSMEVEFFQILATGAGGAEHPITVLDKRLQRLRREGLKISNRDYLGLFIQAWNAWVQGRSLSKLQRPRGGGWSSETFPHPVAPRRAGGPA